MGNMHLVTGYQGQDHVTAADHGSMYAAIFGNGSYVLDRGNKLAASVISSNKVRIADGDIVLQGRHIRLNEGANIDLTIENGTQGYKRNDLIVARYTRNASTGIEEANLVVIKGAASTSTPADPAYNNGDILTDHAEVVDFPLYRVPLDGITVGTLEQLFDVAYFATLGADGKIPTDLLPAMNYIPSAEKGKTSGVASLDASGKVPNAQLGLSGGISVKAAASWFKLGSSRMARYVKIGGIVFYEISTPVEVTGTPGDYFALTYSIPYKGIDNKHAIRHIFGGTAGWNMGSGEGISSAWQNSDGSFTAYIDYAQHNGTHPGMIYVSGWYIAELM